MKKIMFKDKYGLTDAVLQERKTMTRRMIKDGTPLGNWEETEKYAKYKIGEVVAVAQSYKDAGIDPHFLMFQPIKGSTYFAEMEIEAMFTGGWNNKMFVRADLMPHQIKITDIKVERLQDISEEDLEKEGVEVRRYEKSGNEYVFYHPNPYRNGNWGYVHYYSLQDAGRAFFDSISGKGTWERNPWVLVYSFKLVR